MNISLLLLFLLVLISIGFGLFVKSLGLHGSVVLGTDLTANCWDLDFSFAE